MEYEGTLGYKSPSLKDLLHEGESTDGHWIPYQDLLANSSSETSTTLTPKP